MVGNNHHSLFSLINTLTQDGTGVIVASRWGKADVVNALLTAGADVNAKDSVSAQCFLLGLQWTFIAF